MITTRQAERILNGALALVVISLLIGSMILAAAMFLPVFGDWLIGKMN